MSALVLTQPVPPRRRSASTRPTPVGPTTTRAASGPPARSHAPRGGTGVFGPTRHRLGAALRDDAGASTAEYAITVLAACGFAAVLVLLLKSGEVRELLMNIITSALSLGQ
ncbi:DUF4244 domain-containing protein [Brachybacterium halotolerans subsp. kimchii]|uniref:DUF4244 domain-containing protein n=1 Tax=Brachybacterium halotolerans TaxID=2795215 RepID=UPI001E4D81D5|nr:DUF4244 domain-containing protein [Brachybacterium halotolerans]UEJ84117.1 DUF4244 domain-containing protein [Brachybacterium halotolerans subsp. kimchii]